MVKQIFTIDAVLNRHYTLLKENPYLIRRNDFLFSIQKLKTKLAALIELAEEKKGLFFRRRLPEVPRTQEKDGRSSGGRSGDPEGDK